MYACITHRLLPLQQQCQLDCPVQIVGGQLKQFCDTDSPVPLLSLLDCQLSPLLRAAGGTPILDGALQESQL